MHKLSIPVLDTLIQCVLLVWEPIENFWRESKSSISHKYWVDVMRVSVCDAPSNEQHEALLEAPFPGEEGQGHLSKEGRLQHVRDRCEDRDEPGHPAQVVPASERDGH